VNVPGHPDRLNHLAPIRSGNTRAPTRGGVTQVRPRLAQCRPTRPRQRHSVLRTRAFNARQTTRRRSLVRCSRSPGGVARGGGRGPRLPSRGGGDSNRLDASPGSESFRPVTGVAPSDSMMGCVRFGHVTCCQDAQRNGGFRFSSADRGRTSPLGEKLADGGMIGRPRRDSGHGRPSSPPRGTSDCA